MKIHIGPQGPGECTAKEGSCPFAASEDHFDSLEAAQREYEARMARTQGLVQPQRGSRRLTAEEKTLREKNFEAARTLVASRAEGPGVVFDDANPERAQRRLQEAIEYARSRGNEHLSQKLAKANVLPSGAFKTADGTRVNTDGLLKLYSALKELDEVRERTLEQMASKLTIEHVGDKITHKDLTGSYTVTVTEGFQENEFFKLPNATQRAISSPKSVIDPELAREKLTPEEYESITNETQVIDYILGKKPATGSRELSVASAVTPQETLQGLAGYYGQLHAQLGKARDLKTSLAEGTNAIKAVAAKKQGNTFAPARSQYNGAIVTTRRTIDSKKALALLGEERLKTLTKETLAPDEAKAAGVLKPEDFDRIFRAKKLSLRVVESK